MSKVRTIDTHSHVLTQQTAALLRKEAPKVPVTITPIDEASATLDVGGIVYRPFPRGGFDIAHRLRDMDAAAVDVQVLSATPQTYLYNQDAGLGAATAAIQNDQIAKLVSDSWGLRHCRRRRRKRPPANSDARSQSLVCAER
jgi:aminocarboxymuconate-semialdehyde decarboxylase